MLTAIGENISGGVSSLIVSTSGNSVSWYTSKTQVEYAPGYQLNHKGKTYRYVALY